jgi:hypothetical protein
MNRVYSTAGIAVVPGQTWEVSVAVKASITMNNVSNYGIVDLWGSASGPPGEEDTWGANFPGLSVSRIVITTGYSVQTVRGTVPAGVFVMRPMFSAIQISGSTASVWLGNITVKEVIS